MKGIEAEEGEIEDEDSYFDTISRGIEQSKIDPSTIILGTSKDGKRKITWGEVTKKSREHELEL